MEPVGTFDAGYLIAVMAGIVGLCWVFIFGAGDDAEIPHDDWDEFEPKPPADPENTTRLTAF